MPQKEEIIKRLRVIQGQIGGIARMMEEGKECRDIFTQMKAVKSGISSVAEKLVTSYMKECLSIPLEGKKEEEFEMLMKTFSKF